MYYGNDVTSGMYNIIELKPVYERYDSEAHS